MQAFSQFQQRINHHLNPNSSLAGNEAILIAQLEQETFLTGIEHNQREELFGPQ